MKHIIAGIAAAMTLTVLDPAGAQVPAGQPQGPSAAYADPYGYGSGAPTPADACRRGLISRWEFERLEGPLPSALQGPSPNGNKGSGGS